jgi:uncharacterized protein
MHTTIEQPLPPTRRRRSSVASTTESPLAAKAALVRALMRPAAFPHPAEDIQLHETHISWIILAGEHAYKIKKPLNLGFLDFSEPVRRAATCEEEVRLNRRLAPTTYRGTVPVVERGGEPFLGGAGPVLETAIWMRRLPADGMLPALLARGEATATLMRRIARTVARFHARGATGPGVDEYGSPANIVSHWRGNFTEMAPFVDRTLPQWQLERIQRSIETTLEREQGLFARRIAEHRIRDGHGDLHAGSICLVGRELVIFDCLEFSAAYRCSDVAAEVAFLVMDLAHAGRADLGWAFAAAYVRASGDPELLRLLDFYACYRAYVRGKVTSLRLAQDATSEELDRITAEARGYFDLATAYAGDRSRPTLIAMCGLPGTGKSTLAGALARRLGMVHLSTDVTRKTRAGLDPTARPSEDQTAALYSPETTRRTYAALRRQARTWLARGMSTILDGTYNDPRERALARDLARRSGARFILVETTCAEREVKSRLAMRAADPTAVSDASWDVYRQLLPTYRPPDELPADERIVDASGGADPTVVIRRLLA